MKEPIDWRNHLIELLVVIIGISIAFALNNWSEGNKEKQSERDHLQSLITDLETDIATLQSHVDSMNAIRNKTMQLFGILYSPGDPKTRLEHAHITAFYSVTYFKPKSSTYNAILASGNFELIRDYGLRSAISELYNVHYEELADMDRFVRNLVDTNIYPFMLKHIEFSRTGLSDHSPLMTTEFTNLSGSFVNIMERRKQVYEEIRQRSEELRTRIEAYLG